MYIRVAKKMLVSEVQNQGPFSGHPLHFLFIVELNFLKLNFYLPVTSISVCLQPATGES